jgi:Zn finger protein HypA/HybF involved in hydrogenase expression
MKNIRKATIGELTYQQPGYFIVDKIVTFRCESCFQHMSLLDYDISSTGVVTPDIVCPNCKNVHVDVQLTSFPKIERKAKGEIKTKR